MTDHTDQTKPGGAPREGRPPATPGWVKVSGIVVGAVLLVFLILKLAGAGGQHGPGMHQSSAFAVEPVQLASATPSVLPARSST